jgi:5-methyltetrahydrofolate--homocysteine methyltransferase
MQHFVEHARKNGMDLPILCGGAAINSNYINRIAKDDGIYAPGVFYCKNMFEGLKTMEKLVSNEKSKFLQEWKTKLESWKETKIRIESFENFPRSGIKPVTPPTPPVINKPIRLEPKQIDLYEVWKFINKKSLFTLSWGLRGNKAKELEPEHEKLLQEWKERIIKENLFEQRVVYGYYKCHNKDNKLVVEYQDGKDLTFEFPRSSREKHLCLTDYFGEDDIVAFQVVTVGNRVSELVEKWNKEEKYTDGYYLHGIAVETAEAMAEWINQRIRNELKIGEKRGLRYSWGYPSCPDIAQHHLVWKLLEPEKSKITLTEAGQIVPEQSTAAIIVHHPEAEYFVI